MRKRGQASQSHSHPHLHQAPVKLTRFSLPSRKAGRPVLRQHLDDREQDIELADEPDPERM